MTQALKEQTVNKDWVTLCGIQDLVANSGICALVAKPSEQGEQLEKQIAIFSIPDSEEKVFAVDNFDPIGKANVLYRGIVGSNNGEPIVASPLYKQQFSLKTGTCIQEEAEIGAYPARIQDQAIQVYI
ncbi:nitrite reductase small subunit NirD [Thalassotalea euphylliae]|uniref:Nitrite reductase (NAD(P)H) small subunit n=1 Tax=Thalassotalea euphylliae TaxID=1655234 RepID=A0A3E0TYC4_9GAMM|nr:nitrite reductase small subunit NirD [Thalassotalea euphylliae]REL29419.1 nitrite reductase (NAD(P)H) small subunit [Thalassotalea euphylliae]REL35450.1 nitrite reductase (NAD(P)H) small subunit [Thalassotalea euphylliae]